MRRESAVLLAVGLLLPALYFGFAPILQFPHYHDLADQRSILGVRHFWNIVSNLPFLLVGVTGLSLVIEGREEASGAWAMVFGGTLLAAFGSGWYHANPNDATLVWDRLPIGLAFMGFLGAVLVEHLQGAQRRLVGGLMPLATLFSVATIWWWYETGDLSLWVWVQVAPMVAIVLVLILLRGRYTHRRYLGYALACYAAAKGLELGDVQVMQWTGGAMSGHALKHIVAAAGVWCFYVMLRDRKALGETK
jgi:hypothetical protein